MKREAENNKETPLPVPPSPFPLVPLSLRPRSSLCCYLLAISVEGVIVTRNNWPVFVKNAESLAA